MHTNTYKIQRTIATTTIISQKRIQPMKFDALFEDALSLLNASDKFIHLIRTYFMVFLLRIARSFLLAIGKWRGRRGWAQKLHCVECVLRYFLFENICETNKHLRFFIHSDTKSHRTEQTFLFSPFSISYVDKMNVLFHLWFTRK